MLATMTSSALQRSWMQGIETRCPRDRMRAARNGAVKIAELHVEAGRLRAWADAFEVVIECRPLSGAAAERVRAEAENLSPGALDLLRPVGADLRARCSCPDWSPMCVHAAAAYFAFLDHAHEDPRAMLELRSVAACDDTPDEHTFEATERNVPEQAFPTDLPETAESAEGGAAPAGAAEFVLERSTETSAHTEISDAAPEQAFVVPDRAEPLSEQALAAAQPAEPPTEQTFDDAQGEGPATHPLAAFWQGSSLPPAPTLGETRSALDVIGAPPWLREQDEALVRLYAQVMEHGRARIAQAERRARALERALQVRAGAAALWVPAPLVDAPSPAPAPVGVGTDETASGTAARAAAPSAAKVAPARAVERPRALPGTPRPARDAASTAAPPEVQDAPAPRRRGRPPKRLLEAAGTAAAPQPALSPPASTRTSERREVAPLRLSASQRKGMKVARTVPLSEVVYAVATGVDVQVARLELAELQRAGLLVARGRGTQKRFVPAPQ